jgi:hypothetical protein
MRTGSGRRGVTGPSRPMPRTWRDGRRPRPRAAEFDTGPSLLLQRDCELRRLSRVQSSFGGTTEIQKEIIARSLGASGPRGESGGAGASGLVPGVGFSMASEVAAQGRSSGKRERRVHRGGGDVLGIWVCRAEAAEKFPARM